MRLERLVARGFRNLADLECELPPEGVALLGANGQGKTNFLEAVYFPVLFRSFRGAGDADIARFGAPGFRVAAHFVAGTSARSAALTFERVGKRKRIEVDGAPVPRLAQAIGHWIAVAFLPDDLTLAAGPAAARRRYLDRTLALAEPGYLGALTRFRSALRQRNAALRQRRSDLAQAFDSVLGTAGAAIVSRRMAWVEAWRDRFAEECAALGEREPAELAYTGNPGLADASAWTAALARSADQERATGTTRVGPHRDDLRISLAGRVARDFGSTGQQRGVAIALRLLERAVIDAARGQDTPILLDDVFAALDSGRQARLSQRLFKGRGQVFVTAPREDELPAGIQLPVWRVEEGRVTGH